MSGVVRRVKIDEVEVGMHVCGFEKEGESITYVNNLLVRNRRDIERFCGKGYSHARVMVLGAGDSGLEMDILGVVAGGESADGKEEDTREENAINNRHDGASCPDKGIAFLKELDEAKKIRSEAEGLVRAFMTDMRKVNTFSLESLSGTVGRMVGSILRNHDALTSLTRLKSIDDYTFAHSVNVCILSLAVGIHMGLDKKSLHDLGVGALVHDVGKAFVPAEILLKKGKLSDPEFNEMKRHTLAGTEALAASCDITTGSMSVVRHHHEKYNGKGYPDRVKGEDIHIFARIARVADTYDAMTSDRVYQKAMTPYETLRDMYLMRKKEFDPQLVERFIKCVGVYPVGTLVELNTGEVGAVMVPNDSDPLSPIVLMLYDQDRMPYPSPFDVDLEDDITRQITDSKSYEGFNISQDDLLKKIGII